MPTESPESFEYVVVGGGSGGCVVAARLREAGAHVLLLEAGQPDDHTDIHIPAFWLRLQGSAVDWNDETEPQAHLNGRRVSWPSGKTLGGSSSINAMIYIRGHPTDYDGWAAAGNRGWSYADVLPYFQRAENYEGGADAYHGAGGPLHVENRRYTHAITDAITAGFRELGFPANDDFNGATMEGVGRYHVTQHHGARHSAAVAYLHPALAASGPGRLDARTGAHVTRILFDGRRAVGVEYSGNRGPRQVAAERGVILAAGAITSPHLLMLSGVGERAMLEAAGVTVLHDLPGVGKNLQDHLFVPVTTATATPDLQAMIDDGQLALYLAERRGMLCSNIAETGGFMKTDPALDAPDLQFINDAFGEGCLGGYHYTMWPSLLLPLSRGQLTLAGADPQARPRIDPNYLAEPQDMEVLVRGIELARQAGRTDALKPYCLGEVMPGEAVQDRVGLEAYVREQVATISHPVGTCRMGHDDLAVVDDQLSVRGLEQLWIADASVMPVIPRGNTNAPTIMIAEKAADLILGRHAPSRADLGSA